MLELIKDVRNKLAEIKHAVIHEMEEQDTRNWHNSIKYINADLNVMYVLLHHAELFAKELIETYEEELE